MTPQQTEAGGPPQKTEAGGPPAQGEGPWPFVTHRRLRLGGRSVVWRARAARRGLLRDLERELAPLAAAPVPVWRRRAYNQATGLLFAAGSLLFMLGAALSLMPKPPLPSGAINLVFFAGSIPFTLAGYLQLLQAANPPEPGGGAGRVALIGWRPRDAGWLSAFAQFLGTIQFNFNTFDAIVAPNRWYVEDVAVWIPGMAGSVLFLASGYLAFVETCGGWWRWRPQDLDWRIAAWNLAGCVFFLTASTLAFAPQGGEAWWIPALANLHLLLGAAGFLIGALLSLREVRAQG